MSSRKERKEALRQERERREAEARAAQQRKRMVGIGGGAVLAIAAIVILVVVATGSGGDGGNGVQGEGNTFPSGGSVPKQEEFDISKAAAAAGCELESNRATSRDHIQDPAQKLNYRENPPTSGKHFAVPADDGLYNGAPPPDTALVHSLEHGRVIIWVKPSLPRRTARADPRAVRRGHLPDDRRATGEHALRGGGDGLERRPDAAWHRAHTRLPAVERRRDRRAAHIPGRAPLERPRADPVAPGAGTQNA